MTAALMQSAPDVFVEAEDSAQHTFSDVGEFESIVSGGKILRLWETAEPPAKGYRAALDFTLASVGMWHVWLAASVPTNTSPWWWRVNQGEWRHVTLESIPDENLFTTRFGVSDCMGWFHLLSAELPSEKRMLEIRVDERRDILEKAQVSIPRQSRGLYVVSRSKRLCGDANAAPLGLRHLTGGGSA
jgi:hypothetical protein